MCVRGNREGVRGRWHGQGVLNKFICSLNWLAAKWLICRGIFYGLSDRERKEEGEREGEVQRKREEEQNE